MIVVDTNVVNCLLLPRPKTALAVGEAGEHQLLQLLLGAAKNLGVPLVTEDQALLLTFPAMAKSLHQAIS